MGTDVIEVCKRATRASGFDLSLDHLAIAKYVPTDREAEHVPGQLDLQQCLFDQPSLVENVPLELVVAPLDFVVTPESIVNIFHRGLSPEERQAIISSAAKVQVGAVFGTRLDVTYDFLGKVDAVKSSEISRHIEVWVFLGEDADNQFLMYTQRRYYNERGRNAAERQAIEAICNVVS